MTEPAAAAALTINIDMVQALALAVLAYYGGSWLKKRIRVLERFSVPSPVVGGMPLAFVLSVLEANGILQVNFDGKLQSMLMLAFFTTIGMMASLKLIKQGGKLLVAFLAAVTALCFVQNGIGIAVTQLLDFDFHYGILAGSVSMMGGLGTSAAFGPYFEELYGISGGTVVAVTAATFGMVAAVGAFAAPFCQIGISYLAFKVAAALSGVLGSRHGGLLEALTSAAGYVLAMVASATVMTLLACCCFMKVAQL